MAVSSPLSVLGLKIPTAIPGNSSTCHVLYSDFSTLVKEREAQGSNYEPFLFFFQFLYKVHLHFSEIRISSKKVTNVSGVYKEEICNSEFFWFLFLFPYLDDIPLYIYTPVTPQ